MDNSGSQLRQLIPQPVYGGLPQFTYSTDAFGARVVPFSQIQDYERQVGLTTLRDANGTPIQGTVNQRGFSGIPEPSFHPNAPVAPGILTQPMAYPTLQASVSVVSGVSTFLDRLATDPQARHYGALQAWLKFDMGCDDPERGDALGNEALSNQRRLTLMLLLGFRLPMSFITEKEPNGIVHMMFNDQICEYLEYLLRYKRLEASKKELSGNDPNNPSDRGDPAYKITTLLEDNLKQADKIAESEAISALTHDAIVVSVGSIYTMTGGWLAHKIMDILKTYASLPFVVQDMYVCTFFWPARLLFMALGWGNMLAVALAWFNFIRTDVLARNVQDRNELRESLRQQRIYRDRTELSSQTIEYIQKNMAALRELDEQILREYPADRSYVAVSNIATLTPPQSALLRHPEENKTLREFKEALLHRVVHKGWSLSDLDIDIFLTFIVEEKFGDFVHTFHLIDSNGAVRSPWHIVCALVTTERNFSKLSNLYGANKESVKEIMEELRFQKGAPVWEKYWKQYWVLQSFFQFLTLGYKLLGLAQYSVLHPFLTAYQVGKATWDWNNSFVTFMKAAPKLVRKAIIGITPTSLIPEQIQRFHEKRSREDLRREYYRNLGKDTVQAGTHYAANVANDKIKKLTEDQRLSSTMGRLKAWGLAENKRRTERTLKDREEYEAAVAAAQNTPVPQPSYVPPHGNLQSLGLPGPTLAAPVSSAIPAVPTAGEPQVLQVSGNQGLIDRSTSSTAQSTSTSGAAQNTLKHKPLLRSILERSSAVPALASDFFVGNVGPFLVT